MRSFYLIAFMPTLAFYIAGTYLSPWIYEISRTYAGLLIGIWSLVQLPVLILLPFIGIRGKVPLFLFLISLSFLLLVLPDIWILLSARIIGGICSILFSVILVEWSILLAGSAERSGRFYSYLNFLNALPVIIGPLIANAIYSTWKIEMVFVFSSLIILITVPFSIRLSRNLKTSSRGSSSLRELFIILRINWDIYLLYFMEMVLFMYWFTYLPLLLEHLKAGHLTGMLLSAEALIYTTAQLVNTRIVHRLKSRARIALLISSYAVAVSVLTAAAEIGQIPPLLILISVISAPITPTLYSLNADRTPKGLERASSIAMNVVLKAGWGIGPIIATTVYSTIHI